MISKNVLQKLRLKISQVKRRLGQDAEAEQVLTKLLEQHLGLFQFKIDGNCYHQIKEILVEIGVIENQPLNLNHSCSTEG